MSATTDHIDRSSRVAPGVAMELLRDRVVRTPVLVDPALAHQRIQRRPCLAAQQRGELLHPLLLLW